MGLLGMQPRKHMQEAKTSSLSCAHVAYLLINSPRQPLETICTWVPLDDLFSEDSEVSLSHKIKAIKCLQNQYLEKHSTLMANYCSLLPIIGDCSPSINKAACKASIMNPPPSFWSIFFPFTPNPIHTSNILTSPTSTF